jgi:hypothetical protein
MSQFAVSRFKIISLLNAGVGHEQTAPSAIYGVSPAAEEEL